MDHVEVLPTGQCFASDYIQWQIEQSRYRLGVESVDCVYLHNIEEARPFWLNKFPTNFCAAIETLEDLAMRGRIRSYGLATWMGLRAARDDPRNLSLDEIIGLTTKVAGPNHHMHYIQLPIGLWAPEAITSANQLNADGTLESPLIASVRLGLSVFASAPLLQGELVKSDLSFLDDGLPALSSAQRLVQFSRSIPGVTSVLVGVKQRRHVEELLQVAVQPRSDLNRLSCSER
jgi:predicted aldo/keto reductase-like oxidoreductase